MAVDIKAEPLDDDNSMATLSLEPDGADKVLEQVGQPAASLFTLAEDVREVFLAQPAMQCLPGLMHVSLWPAAANPRL